MPNWCEGNLKVRGKRSKIINFIRNTLVGIDYCFYEKEIPIELEFFRNSAIGSIKTEDERYYLYFKESKMLFPIGTIKFNLCDNEEDNQVLFFGIRQAGDFDVNYLRKLSKVNDVDLRVVGYESEKKFTHEIEIEKGRIIKNITKKYGDEWDWKIDNPSLGGWRIK